MKSAELEPQIEELRKEGADTLDALDLVKAVQNLSDIGLREMLTIFLLALFGASTIATYVLIFFWGFKLIELPSPFVHWLGGATVGEISGLLVIIVKSIFPSGNTAGDSNTHTRHRTVRTATTQGSKKQQ